MAQIEECFPGQREPEADERKHPAARLAAILARVSAKELIPRGERMAVLIDGLDGYDPPVGAPAGDPLAAFLPHALPHGVSVLCTSRLRHPYVSSLEARDGELVRIDLDDPARAADNNATVHTFWEHAASALGLDARFVDAAVICAGGNIQHAVTLQRHLKVLPAEQRRVEDIPRGLAALLERSWERIATDPSIVDGLGILCAAREALSLDELSTVAGWTGGIERRTFVRGARELLVETRRPDGQAEYRLHHDSIRAHIAGVLGAAPLRGYHTALARRLATWPAPMDPAARRYALRHALIHRVEAGDWSTAWQLAADTHFLEAKCRELGAHEVEADVTRAAERCRVRGDAVIWQRLDDLARALARDSHWLRAAPEATAALVWNRLRRFGWSADYVNEQLPTATETEFLRVRHGATESSSLMRDLVGHAGWVNACAVTADGRRVVSASDDRTLKIWDLDSGCELATLEGHADWVSACAVTTDGRRAVSASFDRTLKVWDLDTGRELVTLMGHAGGVSACAVTADNRRVLSASFDRTLKIWDLDTGRELATLEGHATEVSACAVTVDGHRALSASWDGMLKLWDLDRACELATVEAPRHEARGTMVTANGRRVVSASKVLGVRELLDLAPDRKVRGLAVVADGRRAVSALSDGTLEIWDLESRRVLVTLKGHEGCVNACAVTADRSRVISASSDSTLKIWGLEDGRLLDTLQGHGGPVRACVVTADGRRLISTSEDRILRVWRFESGRAVSARECHAEQVSACAGTADGRRLISASWDRTLKIWDLVSGSALATLKGHKGSVNACAVTANGRYLVSASSDWTLKIWDLENAREVATLEGHTGWVGACAVTPDGRRAVSASIDGTVKVWDLSSERVLATLEGHVSRLNACTVTADGRRVVFASDARILTVWDVDLGRELSTLEGHAGAITACVVTADGRRVVSASADQTLKVWDLENGHLLATLEEHAGCVNTCGLTADGRGVVSASSDRTLKIWDLETYACLTTHRGDANYTAVAATETAIVAGDSAGFVWILDCSFSNRSIALSESQRGAPRGEASEPSRRPTRKHTILFLAANPSDTDWLALDREVRAIQAELERSDFRNGFELVTRWAAEPLDLLRALRRFRPTVVHFSGHGSSATAGEHPPGPAPHPSTRGRGERLPGLFFHGPDGRAQLVSTAALEEAFGAAGTSVKLVVLSACYSEAQAESLLAHVDCVIGMGGAIRDNAARSFAIGFYGGLGERESVAAAYRQGRAAIHLEGLPDADRPRLKVRAGVDANQLVLIADLDRFGARD
ncbi:MAG TPA: CHAT domain-containing protein [Kofleriaceae bacterium]|nr:CHAT domain-containing protein [Kofleriaceae bacterium]